MATFKVQMNMCVEAQINKLLEKISSTYDIPLNNLIQLWDPSKGGESPKQNDEESPKQTEEDEIKEEQEQKNKRLAKAKQYNRCQYVFTRGKRKGEMCGARACKNSMYCSKHKKHENKKQKEKNTIPKKKVRTNVLKRIRSINKYYHPETGMVFKSKDEKVVIGKYVNGEVISLDNDDIEICKKYCFKVDSKKEMNETDNSNTELVSEAAKIKKEVENAIIDSNKDAEDIANFLEILQINQDDSYSDEEMLEEED